jgi:hypothetical protein
MVFHVPREPGDPVPPTGESLLFMKPNREQPRLGRVPFHVSVAFAMDGTNEAAGKALMTGAPAPAMKAARRGAAPDSGKDR